MTDPNTVQLTEDGRLKHFLTTEGLSRELLTEILDTADSFISTQERAVKTVPLLRGKTVVNLFFETAPGPVQPSSSQRNVCRRIFSTSISRARRLLRGNLNGHPLES